MFVQSLIGAFSRSYLVGRLIRGMAALLVGGTTLWWIVEQVGPIEGTVLVHVTEPDVEVTVGGQTFSIEERRYAPIECRLRSGRYLLRMKRGDRILYEDWFTVHRGEEVILNYRVTPRLYLEQNPGIGVIRGDFPGLRGRNRPDFPRNPRELGV
jgi:hypothetical protein